MGVLERIAIRGRKILGRWAVEISLAAPLLKHGAVRGAERAGRQNRGLRRS